MPRSSSFANRPRVCEEMNSSEQIANLIQQFNCFGDGASTLAIDPTQDQGDILASGQTLMDNLKTLLVSWRQMNNYPAGKTDSQQGGTLDEFQQLFEAAYDAILNYINSRLLLSAGCYHDFFIELKRKLIAMSVVIEQQPVQTVKIKDIKKKSDSDESLVIVVRCLLPRCLPRGKLSRPDVRLRRTDGQKFNEQCSIDNYQEKSSNSHDYRVEMKVSVHGVKGTKKTDIIMYVLKMDFKIDDVELTIESLPIVFCTHTTQLPILSGYICWFNAFTATHVQDPFVIDDDLIKNECTYRPFHEVYRILNAEFHSAVSVIARSVRSPGKSDTPDSSCQQFYDHCKICLKEILNVTGDTEDVTRDALLKRKIGRDRKICVWEWFFACYKTKYEYVNTLYEKGLLMGFVSKTEAERLLNERSRTLGPGKKVFLLRFSQNYLDNHHGLISPTVVRTGEPEHSKPILASKYKHHERYLGRILLKEMALDDSNLFVLLADGVNVKPFEAVYKDFMYEVEEYEGYRDLRECEETARSSVASYDTTGHVSMDQQSVCSDFSDIPSPLLAALTPNPHDDFDENNDQNVLNELFPAMAVDNFGDTNYSYDEENFPLSYRDALSMIEQ